MQKIKYIIFAILVLFISNRVAYAVDTPYIPQGPFDVAPEEKEIIHTCEYYMGQDYWGSLLNDDAENGILCNIYSDYSHQCYLAIGRKTATTSDRMISIQNWNPGSSIYGEALKSYMQMTNQCPSYFIVNRNADANSYTMWGASTRDKAADLKTQLSLTSTGTAMLEAGLIGLAPAENVDVEGSIQSYIDNISQTLRFYSLDSCVQKNEDSLSFTSCQNVLSTLKNNMNVWNVNVNNWLNYGYIRQSDSIMQNYNQAVTNANDFINNQGQVFTDYAKQFYAGRVQNYIDNISDTLRFFSADNCVSQTGGIVNSESCQNVLSNLRSNIETWNANINSWINQGYVTENDEFIRNYRSSVTSANSFIETSTQEIEEQSQGAPRLCRERGVLIGLRLVGYLLLVAKILVPILLIVLGSVDYAKALVDSSADAVQKSTKSLVNRVILAVVIFIIPTIVNFVLSLIPSFVRTSTVENFDDCRVCIFNPNRCSIPED